MPTPLYGPAETTVPGGTAVPSNQLLTRVFNKGEVIRAGFASATRDPGLSRGDWDFTIDFGSTPTFNHLLNRNCQWSEVNASFAVEVPSTGTYLIRVLGGGEPPDSSHGTAHGLFVSYDPVTVIYCEHGTETSQPGNVLVQLTPTFIEAVLASAGFPELGFLFLPLYWSMFSVETLCDELPPPLPSVDLLDPNISFGTRLDIFKAVSWLSLCRCSAGTPTPSPPPPPVIVLPPGAPAAPTFPCDNVDPCAALIEIQRQLAALSSSVSAQAQLLTVMQRYGEPFAYIPGAVHSGVHVSGSFAIDRLVGMRVTVVERPGTERLFSGVTNYISDLGWLSLLTGDGLIDEIRLTRDTQSWFPRLMPLATQFGISLRDGVVVDLQELEAEP